MPGLKTVLPITFTDTSLPKLRDDPVLPDTGALLLIDPAHSMGAWPAGIPATGAALPNVAQTQAMALLGTTTAADVQPTITYNNITAVGTAHGKTERTPKGGLHAIASQDPAVQAANGDGHVTILLPTPVKQYILTNAVTHTFFLGLWFRTTRAFKTGNQQNWIAGITNNVSATGRYLVQIAASGAPGAGSRVGYHDDGGGVGAGLNGVRRVNVAGVGWSDPANPPGSAGGMLGYLFSAGDYGTVNSYLNAKDAAASGVLYRAYLEDLTASGRTYAQAEAADAAAFTAAFASSGRYYGDTVPTAPATIP